MNEDVFNLLKNLGDFPANHVSFRGPYGNNVIYGKELDGFHPVKFTEF